MTPAISIAASTGRERKLDLAVERLHAALANAREERLGEPSSCGGPAHERLGLLLGGRLGLKLEAVLGGQLVDGVRGARRLDQVREQQRVLLRGDALRLGVVDDECPVRSVEQVGETTTTSVACQRHALLVARVGQRPGTLQQTVAQLLAPGHQGLLELHRRRRHGDVELVDAAQQVAELEAPEHLLQLRAVGRGEDELRHVAVELEVAPHRRQLLRLPRLVGVLGDVLAARRRQLVGVRDHLLERPVLPDQLPGGLVADPRDAGDVVRGVALEPDEVRDLLRPDPVARLDAIGRVHVHVGDPARSHHQRDVLRDELEGVAVRRDDGRLDARLVGVRRERGDDVVRLPALELEVAVAERLDDRAEVRELLAEEIRHRLALRLVVLRDRGPVHGPGVPGDGDALRLVVGEELEEHVREAEQRVRREALARRELLGQREEGAVGEVVSVDEEELAVARRRVVDLELCAGQGLWHRDNGIVRAAMPAVAD